MDPPPAKHIVQCISPQFSINKRKFSFSEYVGEHHVACTLLTNMSVQLLQIFQRKSISFHRPYHFIDTVSLYLLVVLQKMISLWALKEGCLHRLFTCRRMTTSCGALKVMFVPDRGASSRCTSPRAGVAAQLCSKNRCCRQIEVNIVESSPQALNQASPAPTPPPNRTTLQVFSSSEGLMQSLLRSSLDREGGPCGWCGRLRLSLKIEWPPGGAGRRRLAVRTRPPALRV